MLTETQQLLVSCKAQISEFKLKQPVKEATIEQIASDGTQGYQQTV